MRIVFGERVRHLRGRTGMSQENLALACGLDRSYVGSVERGQRNVSLLNIQRFAMALSVTLEELFRGL